MVSTPVAAIGAPCLSTVSNTCEGRTDLDSRRLSGKFCSFSRIDLLRTTLRREERWDEPWRLPVHSSKKRGHAAVRSEGISSHNLVERKSKVGDTDKVHELIIVGAGIAGLSTAVAMDKIGVKSLVLEQSAGLRTTGSALSLWRNAWHVLDVLGVGDQLRSLYSPVTGLRFFNQKGDLLKAFELEECPEGPHELRGVERKVLAETLASVLPQGTISFNTRVTAIKRDSEVGPFELTLSDDSVVRTRVLLGADGVNSVVAKWMGLSQTRYVGYMGIRGLATYPDGHPYGTSTGQYYGAGARAGVTPISPTKVYWFFTYNKSKPGPKVTDPNEVKEELLTLLEGWPELMYDLLEHTPLDSLSRAALSDRWSLPGTTPVVQRGVSMVGDALHPMTPNLGQGGCCALEDSIVLVRTLGAVLADSGRADYQRITEALEEYAAERRQRTLPLTVKAFVMGSLLQISFPPVVFIRDKLALPKMVRPGSFLSHTLYNPGQLPLIQAVTK